MSLFFCNITFTIIYFIKDFIYVKERLETNYYYQKNKQIVQSTVTRIARTTSLTLKIKNQTGADPANATYCQQVGSCIMCWNYNSLQTSYAKLNTTMPS